MHIGLHKTGTTAFQNACYHANEALAVEGILYSTADYSTLGTTQHLSLSNLLRSGKPVDRAIELLRQIQAEKPDAKIMLISSEDLSTFFGYAPYENKARDFLDLADKHFENTEYFCVIRNELKLLRSVVIQTIEGEGIPNNGKIFVDRLAERMFEKCEQIASVFGSKLHVIKYEQLPCDVYSSSLLSTMLEKDFSVKEYISNVTSGKDILRTILGAGIRRFFMNTLGANHPYAKEVNVA